MAKRRKTEKAAEKKQKKSINAWIIAVIIVLLIAGTYWYIKILATPEEEFEYRGIKIHVNTDDPNRTVYQTTFTINRELNGTYTDVRTTFLFRNDPRKLHNFGEKIFDFLSISSSDNLIFIKENKTYLSYAEPLPSCKDNFAAAFGLSSFLTQYGLDVKGATANANTERENAPFADCGNSTENTVIIVKESEETGFKQISDNCYEISFKKCEILKATERFQFAVLQQDFGN